MSDHLNKKWAARLRNGVFHRIEQRGWLRFIGGVLAKKGPFNTEGFDYTKPVNDDDLEPQAVSRRALYATQMEFMEKLSDKYESKLKIEEWLLPLLVHSHTYARLLWSSHRDMQRELEPMQIASVIRLTKRATKLKLKHIPTFFELCHCDDYLVIRTSSQPYCL